MGIQPLAERITGIEFEVRSDALLVVGVPRSEWETEVPTHGKGTGPAERVLYEAVHSRDVFSPPCLRILRAMHADSQPDELHS